MSEHMNRPIYVLKAKDGYLKGYTSSQEIASWWAKEKQGRKWFAVHPLNMEPMEVARFTKEVVLQGQA